MEVRVLPPQLDLKKLRDLARVEIDPDLERDIERILTFVEVLKEVPEDVEPLFVPYDMHSPLREDVPGETYPDLYMLAPDREGRYVRFLSPIGRKT